MKLMNRDKLSRSPKKSVPASIIYNNDDMTNGIQTFENGDIYTGDFLDGKKPVSYTHLTLPTKA